MSLLILTLSICLVAIRCYSVSPLFFALQSSVTPLLLAATRDHGAIIKMLVQAGAEVDSRAYVSYMR